MLRNVVILTPDGEPLFWHHFAACHSFGAEPEMFAEYITTIYLLAEQHPNSDPILDIGEEKMGFLHTLNLLVVVLADFTDSDQLIRFKLREIATLFERNYGNMIATYSGNPHFFDPFRSSLVQRKIAKKTLLDYLKRRHFEDNGENSPIAPIIPN
jgi:hypothetical protein